VGKERATRCSDKEISCEGSPWATGAMSAGISWDWKTPFMNIDFFLNFIIVSETFP